MRKYIWGILPVVMLSGCANIVNGNDDDADSPYTKETIQVVTRCAAGAGLGSEVITNLVATAKEEAKSGEISFSMAFKRLLETEIHKNWQSDESRLKALGGYLACEERHLEKSTTEYQIEKGLQFNRETGAAISFGGNHFYGEKKKKSNLGVSI